MTKHRRILRTAVSIAITGVAALLVYYFDIPDHIMLFILIALLFVKHEQMLDKLSMDVSMIESFLDERHGEDANFQDNEFRRNF